MAKSKVKEVTKKRYNQEMTDEFVAKITQLCSLFGWSIMLPISESTEHVIIGSRESLAGLDKIDFDQYDLFELSHTNKH